jgi:hypothetical protein
MKKIIAASVLLLLMSTGAGTVVVDDGKLESSSKLTSITEGMNAQPLWAGNLVEIQLIDKLDEQRGFCIDIRGHKERAKIEGGLQAHTCYSYQGQLGVDQAFDKQLISRGRFYLPAFDVCMEANGSIAGSRLNLEACDDIGTQRFKLTAKNQIKLMSDNELCLAIDPNGSKQGGGGTPPHLLRSLSLANCQNSETKYTTWLMRSPSSN